VAHALYAANYKPSINEFLLCDYPHSDRLGFYPSIDIQHLNRQADEHMDFPE
jgi:hypothetical protein